MKKLIAFLLISLSSLAVLAQGDMVKNKGQWHPNVLYRSELSNGALFLEKNGMTVVLHDSASLRKQHDYYHGDMPRPALPFTFKTYAYKMVLEGADFSDDVLESKKSATAYNYFIGNDRSKWAGDCGGFGSLTYRDVYPGIDVHYYISSGKFKYDFLVHPGADPGRIKIRYDGVKELQLDKKGNLQIPLPVGDVQEEVPYAYAYGKDGRKEVKAAFKINKNQLSFDIENYDRSKELVIDPSLIFSSFTGSYADNWGYTATPGADGSLYAGGIVFGTGYQVSPGAYDVTFNGPAAEGFDIGIFKFSPNGDARIYATYLGGANGSEQPHSLIEDNAGNLIIAGRTNSTDYPLTAAQVGPGGKFDIIVSKLNSTGSALTGSIKIGGVEDDGVNIKDKLASSGSGFTRRYYGDDARSEVIVDSAGNIYLASCTQSSNIPGMTAALQTNLAGLQDGIIIKLPPTLAAPTFMTYFGGAQNDACFVLDFNPLTGNLYIGGASGSASLPGIGAGVLQQTNNGGDADGFVAIMKPDGSQFLRTSFIASSTPGSVDLVYGLKFDKDGFPYIMGTTTGSFPVINATYSNPGAKQYIAKLRPDISAYVYSTVFGKADTYPSLSPVAFLVDRCQNVYMSGWGGTFNMSQGYQAGNTMGLPEVDPLPGIPAADGNDFYFFVLKKDAASCLFASHFGENSTHGDHVDGGTSRFDASGYIYQGICGNCGRGGRFPTTPGVVFPTNNSTNCNQAAVKIFMNYAGVQSRVKADTIRGCTPLTVNFTDSIKNGVKYYYTFGDGSPVYVGGSPDVLHTFNASGTYTVMQIAEDSSACNIRDTSYIRIIANAKKATIGFNFVKMQPCQQLNYTFTNTSTVTTGSFAANSFTWDFGDGSAPVVTGNGPVNHTFPAIGNYTISLRLNDSTICNSPLRLDTTISVNPYVKAQFILDTTGCTPFTVTIRNTSQGATSYAWQFDDGTIFSTDVNATYTFTTPGRYRIRLIASNPNSCNLSDTSEFKELNIPEGPKAAFTWSPNPPSRNIPATFTNLSQNAVSYVWLFGDSTSSTLVNPVHQYDSTGNYTVILIARSNLGCTDTARETVSAIVDPLLDVPNAFTPGKFGINAYFSPRSFGVRKMEFKIYNRWGQLLFTSGAKSTGWDGTYKGKPQPMEVYVWTVDAEFIDGKKVHRSGDVTLIR